MPDLPITVTPSVLLWAREASGYMQEEVVERLKQKRVTIDVIQNWETGASQPTYSQLKKLAGFYMRPIAIFFFSEPPDEDPVFKDFRSLPSEIGEVTPPSIRHLVRLAKARQLDLQDLHGTAAKEARIVSLARTENENAKELATRMRAQIGVSVEDQIRWKDITSAFDSWRAALENIGVWVFKNAFKNDNYCGFCVHDHYFPVIYVNSSEPKLNENGQNTSFGQSKQRQIFTLFHELGHLLRGTAGIDFRKTPAFTGIYHEEEVFCNVFANTFLVPDEEFTEYNRLPDEFSIEELAKKYKVSFDVILHKFLNRHLVSQDVYNRMIENRSKRFVREARNKKQTSGGPGYYITQHGYLGRKYLTLAFEQYHLNRISERHLADCLGVKVKSLSRLEQTFHDLAP